VLSFTVDVPATGRYDLSVFANSLNTYPLVQEQGPTNVFLRVDGAAEQQLFLPLGYKWVVWDHTDTTVQLTKGTHTIALAARSLDGSKATRGDAILDRITLSLPNPVATTQTYEAELADLRNSLPVYGLPRRVSGSGDVALARGGAATFWVYSKADAESVLDLKVTAGSVRMAVNGIDVPAGKPVAVSLSGGINKVTVTGTGLGALIDKLDVRPGAGALKATTLEAEKRDADRHRRGGRAAAGRRRSSGHRDHRRQHAHLLGAGGPGRGRTRCASGTRTRAGRRHPLQPRPARPARRHRRQRRRGETGALPAHLPRRQLLGADRAGAAETRRQHDPFLVGRTAELRRRHLRLGHLAGILLRSKYAPDVDNVTVAPFAKALPGR
jgi:hypothetical protein